MVRFATFNACLTRAAPRGLRRDLSTPYDRQARAVAEIIQRTRPDVLLVNELDFDPGGVAVDLFHDNYLAAAQGGAAPIDYPYRLAVPSNTGELSGFDLDGNGVVATASDLGTVAYARDCWGYGRFPGQYAFAVYSRFPMREDRVRTFRRFLWKDMPGALLPVDASRGCPYHPPEVTAQLRLSSKNHADIPIVVGRRTVHLLASHPTPPAFDGPERRNVRRNHDEIRFWADYVTPGRTRYVYDDAGRRGGLRSGSLFVIAGDLNADPFDGGSIPGAAQLLLGHPLVNTDMTPSSVGGVDRAAAQGKLWPQRDPAHDTADFAEPPGNLRVDYVLPSRDLEIRDAAVFWPGDDDPLARLTGPGFPRVSSDHRLVWIDVSHAGFPAG